MRTPTTEPDEPTTVPSASEPDASVVPPTEVNAIVAFLQSLLSTGNIRQDFNPTTPQFWTMLGAVAAIVVAWLNPSGLLNAPVQVIISAVGGLVIALFTHHAASKMSITKLRFLLEDLGDRHPKHKGIIAKSFSPTILVPSPAGKVPATGFYPLGTSHGSVLAPGAVVVVAPPGGGQGGHGGTTPGFTTEGNVSGPVTINVTPTHFVDPNVEPYAPISPTAQLPGQVGTNTSEGTGGPVISQRQGGLGVGGSVSAPGAYVPPTPSVANPDEASPQTFVAKEVKPEQAPEQEPK